LHSTWRLTTYVGCSHPDPDHSYAGGRSEVDNESYDFYKMLISDLMNGWELL